MSRLTWILYGAYSAVFHIDAWYQGNYDIPFTQLPPQVPMMRICAAPETLFHGNVRQTVRADSGGCHADFTLSRSPKGGYILTVCNENRVIEYRDFGTTPSDLPGHDHIPSHSLQLRHAEHVAGHLQKKYWQYITLSFIARNTSRLRCPWEFDTNTRIECVKQRTGTYRQCAKRFSATSAHQICKMLDNARARLEHRSGSQSDVYRSPTV